MLVLPFLFLLTLLSIAAGKVQDNGQAREQCPYGWVEATYIEFGIRIHSIKWSCIFYVGCIFINTTSLESMPWHNAYQFCYNLNPRARLVEIHTPEQLDFLNILLSKN